MTPWLLATIALLIPLCIALFMCGRGGVEQRFAAMQLVGSLGTLLLVLMTFAFAQASSIDLALTLGLLMFPATLLFALFVERYL